MYAQSPSWPLILVMLAGAARCAHVPDPVHIGTADKTAPSDGRGPSGEAQAAEATYDRGLKQLKRGLYQESIHTFDEVKLQYPYSRHAPLAELRAADAHSKQQNYIEAIEGYRAFLRFHPAHQEAPYALEQIGEGYYAQIPSDWWPMPPSAEKDLQSVRQAIAAYEDLLGRFAGGNASAKAQKHLDACRKKLAEHELFVARFYHGRKRWPGAAKRAQTLLASYPGLGLDAEALWLAGTAELAQGHTQKGQILLDTLLRDHATSLWARRVGKHTQQPAAPARLPTHGQDDGQP